MFSLHNVNEMQQLMTDAGFNEVSVTRDEKTFKLPVPKDFLWQYIKSTPLAAMTAQADEDTLTRFEDKVLSTWSEFEEDGNLIDHLNIMVASACK